MNELAKPSWKNSPNENSNDKYARAERVFLRLHAIFGVKWTAGFDQGQFTRQLALAEWDQALERVTDEVLARVLDYIRQEAGLEWPPNLSQFMGYCRQFQRGPAAEVRKALPEPDEIKAKRKENAMNALAYIKTLVGHAPRPEPPKAPRALSGCTCKAQGTCPTCVRLAELTLDLDDYADMGAKDIEGWAKRVKARWKRERDG